MAETATPSSSGLLISGSNSSKWRHCPPSRTTSFVQGAAGQQNSVDRSVHSDYGSSAGRANNAALRLTSLPVFFFPPLLKSLRPQRLSHRVKEQQAVWVKSLNQAGRKNTRLWTRRRYDREQSLTSSPSWSTSFRLPLPGHLSTLSST